MVQFGTLTQLYTRQTMHYSLAEKFQGCKIK
jgi:hypothetical protein